MPKKRTKPKTKNPRLMFLGNAQRAIEKLRSKYSAVPFPVLEKTQRPAPHIRLGHLQIECVVIEGGRLPGSVSIQSAPGLCRYTRAHDALQESGVGLWYA